MTQHHDAPTAAMPDTGERYRPQFHFTPQRNWMNDPNGLVFFDGEYHLFYQYNPHGIGWGHMSWGHAISTDLLHWEELPVAIPETDVMIFSGCCVIDWHNTSGLGDGTMPPMLAYFTAHDDVAKRQTQHLAYSLDRGRTFLHYAGNPVIDLDLEHFRDPKVFWHAESGAWIMAVALPREHKVQFYRSADLLDWTFASAFGPAGAISGQWECPDIFLVPVEGRVGESHWVLKVDVDDKFVDGGSGAQYFVGHFDGTAFTIDPKRGSADGDLVDFGPDFYAAVSWSDLPAEQAGPLWIGWMSNHQTGKDYPTDPWRGAQSLPRRLFLFDGGGVLKLGQRPVEQAATMGLRQTAGQDVEIGAGSTTIGTFGKVVAHHISLFCTPDALFTVALASGSQTLLSIAFDRQSESIVFHRQPADGQAPAFARRMVSEVALGDRVALDVYFDGYLLEAFIDSGKRVYSACLFPDELLVLTIECSAGRVTTRT
jgi:fructan beta-fructosidase